MQKVDSYSQICTWKNWGSGSGGVALQLKSAIMWNLTNEWFSDEGQTHNWDSSQIIYNWHIFWCTIETSTWFQFKTYSTDQRNNLCGCGGIWFATVNSKIQGLSEYVWWISNSCLVNGATSWNQTIITNKCLQFVWKMKQ